MIPNPNAPAASAPDVPAGRRAATAALLQGLIAGWPATDEQGVPITHISVHELVAKLRAAPPAGVTAEQITGPRVRALLRQLGYGGQEIGEVGESGESGTGGEASS